MKHDKALNGTPRPPRQGWDEALKSMAERGDDRLIDDSTPTASDGEEWEW